MQSNLVWLEDIASSGNLDAFGNKAKGLLNVIKLGFNVPPTLCLEQDKPLTYDQQAFIWETFGKCDLIVRSSTNVEDSPQTSHAGLFLSSKIRPGSSIVGAVQNIRSHANSKFGLNEIPVIIQTVMNGVGGVYMYSFESGSESLELSRLGSSTITRGISLQDELLSKISIEYLTTIQTCRKLRSIQGTSCDFEIALQGTEVFFLQNRPLTSNIHFSQQSMSEVSEYFPTPIDRLSGSFWREVLKTELGLVSHYENGFLLVHPKSNIESKLIGKYSQNEYLHAVHYYHEILFTRWDSEFESAKKLLSSLSPVDAWQSIRSIVIEFYRAYFTNEYVHIIDNARSQNIDGSGLTPTFYRWIIDLAEAAERLKDVGFPENWQDICFVNAFLKKNEYKFRDPTYFIEPPIVEQKQIMYSLLDNALNINIQSFKPKLNPSPELQASWIALDDNVYKHKFNYIFRNSILLLADYLVQNSVILKISDIWNLDFDEIDTTIQMAKEGISLNRIFRSPSQSYTSIFSNISSQSSYKAVVLSPGATSGIVTKAASSTFAENILVAETLDSCDYPALARSNGAIVSFASISSHLAIFARDIGKPLFRSALAVSDIQEGNTVTLDPELNEIRLHNI